MTFVIFAIHKQVQNRNYEFTRISGKRNFKQFWR